MKPSLDRPTFIFYFYQITMALLFGAIFTASALYQVQTAGLDPLQLVLVGTVLELSVFLFEAPTGAVADLVSRRLSIIIGVFLVGLGFIVEGSFPAFLPILAAQVLWGVGYTFTSGAFQAWITDEIGEERAARAFFRGAQLERLSSLVGIAAGSALALARLNLPVVAGGVGFLLLGAALIVWMPEDGFKPVPREERTTWGVIVGQIRDGLTIIRQRPALGSILAVGLFYGLYSEGFDRMWTAYLVNDFTLPWFPAPIWMGALRVTGALASAAAVEWVNRRVETTRISSLQRMLWMVSGLLVIGLVLFAGGRWLWLVLLAWVLIDVLRSVANPIFTVWINHRLDSNVRATVISISSLVDASGQIAGGPAIGWVGRVFSIRAGLFGSAALLTPVLVFLRGGKSSQDS